MQDKFSFNFIENPCLLSLTNFQCHMNRDKYLKVLEKYWDDNPLVSWNNTGLRVPLACSFTVFLHLVVIPCFALYSLKSSWHLQRNSFSCHIVLIQNLILTNITFFRILFNYAYQTRGTQNPGFFSPGLSFKFKFLDTLTLILNMPLQSS